MDRASAISKIQAMIRLQEGTTFEGEASAAAAMIDKLCRQFGVSVEDAQRPAINDEVFSSFGRMNSAHFRIICAVARFYDAAAFVRGKEFHVIGSEAQQIVVKIYFDFIIECMEQECNKAYQAEKILADLLGQSDPGRTFKHQFRLAFATTVKERLHELKKAEQREHEHAKYALEKIKQHKIGSRRVSSGMGAGASAGHCAGQSVSLHRQASGSQNRQLMAAR